MGNGSKIIFAEPKPPADEEIQGIKFTTYLHYLGATCTFFGENREECVTRQIIELTSKSVYRAIERKPQPELRRLTYLLRNSWFTEALLDLSGSSKRYLGYTNHWTPVQLYYSVYSQLHALFDAMGLDVGSNHAALLRVVSNLVENRPSLFFEPFCLALKGLPSKVSEAEFIGLPTGVELNPTNQLSFPSVPNCWDHFALFLKTTRERQINKLVEHWKRTNKKKRIPSLQKEKIAEQLGPTTFFDALYRLRIRANYQDAEVSLVQLEYSDDALQFAKYISTVSWHTLLNIELILCRYLGTDIYERILIRFVEDEKGKFSDDLCLARWEITKDILRKNNL